MIRAAEDACMYARTHTHQQATITIIQYLICMYCTTVHILTSLAQTHESFLLKLTSGMLHTHTHRHVHTHSHAHTQTYTLMRAPTHACMHAQTSLHTRECTHTHRDTHTLMQALMHARMHAQFMSTIARANMLASMHVSEHDADAHVP